MDHRGDRRTHSSTAAGASREGYIDFLTIFTKYKQRAGQGGGGSHPLFVTSESHKTYHISLFKQKRKVPILLFSIFRNWGEGVKMNYEFI